MTYPHPKPRPPTQLYGLAALAGVGLLALWITAYNAFAAVGGTIHALAAATLIEAALILDMLFVVRHRRSPAAIAGGAGILISVVVSATYNYLSAAAHAPTLSGWPLLALAIGPLSALLFVALATAHELHTYQQAVTDWQRDRADWLETQRLEAERAERERLAQAEAWRREQQQAERARQEREAEHRRAMERAEAAERRAAEERARKRAERAERSSERERTPLNVQPYSSERSDEADEYLRTVAERSGGEPFKRTDVEQWTGRGKTASAALIRAGLESGQLEEAGRHQYRYANGKLQ